MAIRFLDEAPKTKIRFLDEPEQAPTQEGPGTAAQVAEARGEQLVRSPIEVLPEFGRGLIQGGKEVVSGALQAGADVAGRLFPESEGVQEFRELLPEAVARSREQFEAGEGESLAAKTGEVVGQAAPFIAAIPAGAATLAGRAGLGALGGAVAGGTGATTEQLTPEEALAQRGTGAAIGGTVGAALPAVATGVGKVASGVGRVIKGRDADKILASRISATDAKTALQDLKAGKISILPDVAGDEIKGLTRAVAKEKGGARNLVADALEGRSKEAVGRVTKELSKNISNVDTYFGTLDDIAKARSSVAQPLYAKAYTEAPNIERGSLNKLLQDQRIISAIDDAKTNLGVRVEAPANSLEVLDGAKKSLDDIIGSAMRAGQNHKASSFMKLKDQLVKELDAASPTYRKARKVFSDFKSLEVAQEAGLGFSKQTPEQLKIMMKGMDNTQKEAFKIGVRENLQRTASKTSKGGDPGTRLFGNEFKQDQLKAIFGEGDQFKQFSSAIKEEIGAAESKFKILGGSRSDINITDDGQFIEAAANAARGGVIRTAIIDETVGAMSSAMKRRYIGLNTKSAKDLARVLTNREAGIEALEKIIADAPRGQKAIVQDVVDEFGVALGITGAVAAR